ncbi:MAG: peptidoglycan DD-metalloendopeptidase family protein [Porticoccaceae bacterium]|nr:peptidoglycan DD-metalloendopeptidase family protein [Porticoccaceae bacterium]
MSTRQNPSDFWKNLFSHTLPQAHLYVAALVAVGLVVLLTMTPTREVSAYRDPNLLAIQIPTPQILYLDINRQIAEARDLEAGNIPVQDNLTWRVEKVRAGDNLSAIFNRLSRPQSDVHTVANATEHSDAFRRLRPGETIAVALDSDNKLAEVVYERNALESFRYLRTDDGFSGELVTRETVKSHAFSHVTISHSLFLDGNRAGLSHNLIMQLASMFAWDIDFALDIRAGDTFTIVYEEELLDGEKVREGNVLAAEFTNQGRLYQAVRYESADGQADYYTPQGRPMRQAFLRAPLDFTRVSSNFNPARLHPVLKTVRPHRGVDYAAPTGTPVYAAGSGKIVSSGFTAANGNFVVIQHGDMYTTKYLHLHKRSVKAGQTVRQGELIGTVGSTGYATGPHLHYEFLVNGVHTNPRTVALPRAEPIPSQQMVDFVRQTAPLFTQLASYRTNNQLAFLAY